MKIIIRSIVMLACVAAFTVSSVAQTRWTAPSTNRLPRDVYIRHVDRTVLGEDIVHYRFEVAVGQGEFDRIRLHRIIREKHPYQPIHTVNGVLLFPGGPNSVEMIFMEPVISNVPNWDQSITAFLAKNNVDVWAMDYRWALVPASTTDFGFMKTWGLKRDVDDAKIALSLARLIRGATGQGFGQLPVLGFSYGTYMAYSIANQETQIPKGLRNASGLILADWGIVYRSDSPIRKQLCDLIPQIQALFDAGTYNEDNTATALFADLARSAPDAPSQFVEGLTNYQFALSLGTSVAYPPSWHFMAGVFDDNGIPTGLQYTDPLLWFDVLRAIPSYFPVKADVDTDRVGCSDVVPPFDEHIGKIKLPILYVGAAGGTGEEGYFAVGRTASTDITKFTVQLHPDNEAALDYGHADLFAATNAEGLVWQPILDWLVAHK